VLIAWYVVLQFVETVVDPDEHDEHEGMDAASIREHEEVTKVKVGVVVVLPHACAF